MSTTPRQSWRLIDRIGGGALTSTDTPPPTPSEQGPALVGLLAAVVLIAGLAVAFHLAPALITIAILAAVIMLHEAGHFTLAKLSGMKVTEFFLGFGPRLWSVRKGETEYGIKALPLGGYVRILGMNNVEEVDPADEPRTYRQQTFPRRLATVAAGSTVHFLLAIIAAWSLFAFAHQAKVDPVVADFPKLTSGPTPAQKAGLQVGDRIISYDGNPTHGHWTDLHTYIQHHIGHQITFVVQRAGQQRVVHATPEDAATVTDRGLPLSVDHIGFLGFDSTGRNDSLLAAIPHGLSSFWHDGILGTFRGIGAIFSPSGLTNLGKQVVSNPGKTPADQAAGRPTSVVGIVQIAGQLPGWPLKVLLFMQANAFVGVLNLFPILPFDGGHVVLAIYERIRSRRGRRYVADVNKMLPYAMAVVFVIGFVFLSSLYLDVAHPITLR